MSRTPTLCIWTDATATKAQTVMLITQRPHSPTLWVAPGTNPKMLREPERDTEAEEETIVVDVIKTVHRISVVNKVSAEQVEGVEEGPKLAQATATAPTLVHQDPKVAYATKTLEVKRSVLPLAPPIEIVRRVDPIL